MKIQIFKTNWSKFQFHLVTALIISGAINSVCIELMNNTKSKGSHGSQLFYHPFFQGDLVFLGKLLCLLVFKIVFLKFIERRNESELVNSLTKGNRNFDRLSLLQASILNLIAMSATLVGLTMTNVSSYLNLRGFVIAFTAFLSKNRIEKRHKIGIAIIIIGFVLLGLADVSDKTDGQTVVGHAFNDGGMKELLFNANFNDFVPRTSTVANDESITSILLGDGIIFFAQFISAYQMVFEENLMKEFDVPPLLVAGWEGVFGFGILSFFVFAFGILNVNSFEQDFPTEALVKISNSAILLFASFMIITSSTVSSFCGVTVTREMTATTRVVLESFEILFMWIFSWFFGWKTFHWLQVILINN